MVDWTKTEREIDKRIAERCTTHHHACDCREYSHQELRKAASTVFDAYHNWDSTPDSRNAYDLEKAIMAMGELLPND